MIFIRHRFLCSCWPCQASKARAIVALDMRATARLSCPRCLLSCATYSLHRPNALACSLFMARPITCRALLRLARRTSLNLSKASHARRMRLCMTCLRPASTSLSRNSSRIRAVCAAILNWRLTSLVCSRHAPKVLRLHPPRTTARAALSKCEGRCALLCSSAHLENALYSLRLFILFTARVRMLRLLLKSCCTRSQPRHALNMTPFSILSTRRWNRLRLRLIAF
mmetsp:Transcript_961/g.3560  ORF Transcript_961/g.3560 Transcript_961/m.3560 type:complete len:225 (+) Transcript_961:148-822(+)